MRKFPFPLREADLNPEDATRGYGSRYRGKIEAEHNLIA
jgi:hypothetical protein